MLTKTLDALHILFIYKVDYLTNVTEHAYVRCEVVSAWTMTSERAQQKSADIQGKLTAPISKKKYNNT